VNSDPNLRSEFRRALDVVAPPAPWLPTTVREKLRQERRRTSWRIGQWLPVVVVRLPRSSQKMAAAALIVVLAAAALGVFLVAHRPVNRSVPAGVGPPSGTIVFGRVNPNGDEYLFKMHADGTAETSLLATPAVCCGAQRSHKGDRLLLGAWDPGPGPKRVTTATIRADGSGYTVLPIDTPGLNLGWGAWSQDDSRIAFDGWDDGDTSRNGIYTADAADGGNRRRVTNSGQTHDIPISYAPDGSKILFWRGPESSQGTGQGQLFVVGIDGSRETQVSPPYMTVGNADVAAGYWSPDGTHITFAATLDTGKSAVFVAAGDGTNTKQITNWGARTTVARWSPTGDWIVFDNYSGSFQTLFIIHPDGSGTKAISSVGGVCCSIYSPVWSPDGKRLLFGYGPNSSYTGDLWTVQLDGSHLTQLTHTLASLADFGWSAAT
jgi:hypothetical protein